VYIGALGTAGINAGIPVGADNAAIPAGAGAGVGATACCTTGAGVGAVNACVIGAVYACAIGAAGEAGNAFLVTPLEPKPPAGLFAYRFVAGAGSVLFTIPLEPKPLAGLFAYTFVAGARAGLTGLFAGVEVGVTVFNCDLIGLVEVLPNDDPAPIATP
jgi:hypothetical protein